MSYQQTLFGEVSAISVIAGPRIAALVAADDDKCFDFATGGSDFSVIRIGIFHDV